MDLIAVLILLSPLNDRSALQEVTGKVQRIRSSSLMFGNIEVVCGKVVSSVVGREALPEHINQKKTSYEATYQLVTTETI